MVYDPNWQWSKGARAPNILSAPDIRNMIPGVSYPVWPPPRPYAPMQDAYGAARQANLRRYQEILGGYRQRYGDVMGALEGYGASQAAEIQRMGRSAQSAAQQDLTSRGLTGTTVMPSVKAGIQKQTQNALGSLGDRIALLRANMMSSLSGDTLGFMERREDVYPDMAQWLRLLQQYGYGMGYGG